MTISSELQKSSKTVVSDCYGNEPGYSHFFTFLSVSDSLLPSFCNSDWTCFSCHFIVYCSTCWKWLRLQLIYYLQLLSFLISFFFGSCFTEINNYIWSSLTLHTIRLTIDVISFLQHNAGFYQYLSVNKITF